MESKLSHRTNALIDRYSILAGLPPFPPWSNAFRSREHVPLSPKDSVAVQRFCIPTYTPGSELVGMNPGSSPRLVLANLPVRTPDPCCCVASLLQ